MRAKDPESPYAKKLEERLSELDGAAVEYRMFAELAQAYLKLDSRMAKVIAISDKYQMEMKSAESSYRGDAMRALSEAPAEPTKEADPLVARIRERLALENAENDPFAKDASMLLRRYEKANGRLNKIVAISDNYQAQLKDLLGRLDRMAHTDVLTGLPNRRSMLDRLEIEIARAERYGSGFSVALFDVDDFKRVNDTYGHDAGDEVLKRISREFQASMRKTDSCSRWGGEEFLVLFTETDLRAAVKAAEKCAAAVSASAVELSGVSISVTLSGGVREYRQGAEINAILKAADEALYRAKAAGKNRVYSQP